MTAKYFIPLIAQFLLTSTFCVSSRQFTEANHEQTSALQIPKIGGKKQNVVAKGKRMSLCHCHLVSEHVFVRTGPITCGPHARYFCLSAELTRVMGTTLLPWNHSRSFFLGALNGQLDMHDGIWRHHHDQTVSSVFSLFFLLFRKRSMGLGEVFRPFFFFSHGIILSHWNGPDHTCVTIFPMKL